MLQGFLFFVMDSFFKSLWFTLSGFHNVMDEFLIHGTDNKRKDMLYIIQRNLFQDFLFCTLENDTHGSKYTQTFFYFVNKT